MSKLDHVVECARVPLSSEIIIKKDTREPVLGSIDRVSEMIFGLFMTLTFVGALSISDSGPGEVRAMFFAALGCNIAWGLVDAVMYLVRTMTDRGRKLSLIRAIRAAPDAESGNRLVMDALSTTMAGLVSPVEVDAIRQRVVAMSWVANRPTVNRDDLLAALSIFLIVVGVTFPVVLPFVLISDLGLAKTLSRIIALVLLFSGGFILGRYAGHNGIKTGCIVIALGTALVVAIVVLGG